VKSSASALDENDKDFCLFHAMLEELQAINKRSTCIEPGAHPGSLFGCHDKPLCTAGKLLSIKADGKISNAVTAGL